MSVRIHPSEVGVSPEEEVTGKQKILSRTKEFLEISRARASMLGTRIISNQSLLRYLIFWGVNAYLLTRGLPLAEPFTRTLGTQYLGEDTGETLHHNVEPVDALQNLADHGPSAGVLSTMATVGMGWRLASKPLGQAVRYLSQQLPTPKGKMT